MTLPELLIAVTIGLVVLAASGMVMVLAARSEPRLAERSADVQSARTMMERVTRELRQGATVRAATGSSLTVVTLVPRAACGGSAPGPTRSCAVTYNCGSGTCTRAEGNADGTGSSAPVLVAEGLDSAAVFSYAPSTLEPTYIGIKLGFSSSDGDDSITLTDGVHLRNGSGGVA